MSWMEGHFDKRCDPRLLVEGAKSVISVLHNYFHPTDQNQAAKISSYAHGDDYHHVIKDKLRELYARIEEKTGELNGRVFVDSAPVMDKAWARKSGLGWQGKNTNLINRDMGSFFFIGEIISDLELEADGPIPDYCGSCTRCIDACPTDALTAPYQIDASKCISYLTIEHRGDDIHPELSKQTKNLAFGCDICQEVCPWNKFAKSTNETAYLPRPGLLEKGLEDWEELEIDEFRTLFKNSPIKRTKFDGFKRNLRIVVQNSKDC